MVQSRREARHELLVASDSDIRVKPDYLRRLISPFSPAVGCGHTPRPGLTRELRSGRRAHE
jgi:cellulose synthase/poly-beta-1,6-N-acetylglucosamine synthase-like glycosyltransferase